MMTATQLELIRESFKELAPQGEALADAFFERLFAKQPQLRTVVAQDHWQRTQDVMGGLGLLIKNLHRLAAIEYLLLDFGAKAQRAGVMAHQYGVARQTMIDSMRAVAKDKWDEETEAAWTTALTTVTSVVLLGAGRTRAKAA